jgi:membrane protein DedA with SNARE-associated domain
MPTRLDALIAAHGYWVVLAGTFLEGETVLLLGGIAAHRGLLRLGGVIMAAIAGSMAGDQFFFWLGRWLGETWIERRPHWRERSRRALALALRGGWWFLIGFRFLYGLRSVTPLALGAAGFPVGRFVVGNVIGAVVWGVTVGVAGYLLGHAAEAVLGTIRRDTLWLLLVFLVGAVGYWLVRWLGRPRGHRDDGP